MTDNQTVTPASAGKKKLKNDLLMIAALLIAVSLIGVCVYFFRTDGDSVEVRVDGKLYGTYALDEDVTVEIRTGENDEHVNVLVIKDGRASISRADCPDGICSSHKPIWREGESIVCLPNRVTVTVVTDSSGDNAPDIVA